MVLTILASLVLWISVIWVLWVLCGRMVTGLWPKWRSKADIALKHMELVDKIERGILEPDDAIKVYQRWRGQGHLRSSEEIHMYWDAWLRREKLRWDRLDGLFDYLLRLRRREKD